MSAPAYESYKDSGVEWLGLVPSHWIDVRLRYVAELNPSKSEVSDREREEEVSFVPMEAVGEDGSLRLDQTRPINSVESGYTYFAEGDVTIAKITPCFENGKGAVMRGLQGGIGFGTTELIVARPRSENSADFINWLFNSTAFRKFGEGAMYGAGGQKRVPDEFVRNFRFALPPAAEQTAIAAFLDRETGKIDALIEVQTRLIELLKEKRQAVISHAVTKGLNPDAPMKDSGIEWLGQVPAHWEVVAIKRLARLQSGDAITSSEIEFEGEYPVYGGNGFRGFTSKYNRDGYYILIGRQGALCGNINYAEGQFWASEHAIVVHPQQRIETRWFGELLRSMNLGQYSIAAAQPGLSADALGNLRCPWPPYEEQVHIVKAIDAGLKLFEPLIEQANLAVKLFQERRAALISAAVTGKIDVRGLVNIESEAA